ncbi:MAG: phosphoribosylformylglycinamidine synthase subunit PurS [Tepidiformaceae bacterium]
MSKAKKKAEKTSKAETAKAKAPSEKTFLARVYVSLKPVVNDPEGITIGGALGSLGFTGVRGVRSGRYFQVTLAAKDQETAAAQVDQMCARLLANPVIETYSFELAAD